MSEVINLTTKNKPAVLAGDRTTIVNAFAREFKSFDLKADESVFVSRISDCLDAHNEYSLRKHAKEYAFYEACRADEWLAKAQKLVEEISHKTARITEFDGLDNMTIKVGELTFAFTTQGDREGQPLFTFTEMDATIGVYQV